MSFVNVFIRRGRDTEDLSVPKCKRKGHVRTVRRGRLQTRKRGLSIAHLPAPRPKASNL